MALKSGNSELIAGIGRPRVGKTFLIRQFFKNKIDFKLVGLNDAAIKNCSVSNNNFDQIIRFYMKRN